MKHIIVLGGPTASGKSALAIKLADLVSETQQKVNGVWIINADSMQVYKELPVLTAHPSDKDKQAYPHKLYGYLEGTSPCSAGIWLEHATATIDQAHRENIVPIVVGGTGLYLRCLTEGVAAIPEIAQDVRKSARDTLDEIGNSKFHILLKEKDPIMGNRLHPSDSQRMLRAWEVLMQTNQSIHEWQQHPPKRHYDKDQFSCFTLAPEREQLYNQCNKRFLHMLNHGALQEVDALYDKKLDPSLPIMKALGVPELIAFKENHMTFEEAVERAQIATRQFAKRQTTWFRNQFSDWQPIGASEMEDVKPLLKSTPFAI